MQLHSAVASCLQEVEILIFSRLTVSLQLHLERTFLLHALYTFSLMPVHGHFSLETVFSLLSYFLPGHIHFSRDSLSFSSPSLSFSSISLLSHTAELPCTLTHATLSHIPPPLSTLSLSLHLSSLGLTHCGAHTCACTHGMADSRTPVLSLCSLSTSGTLTLSAHALLDLTFIRCSLTGVTASLCLWEDTSLRITASGSFLHATISSHHHTPTACTHLTHTCPSLSPILLSLTLCHTHTLLSQLESLPLVCHLPPCTLDFCISLTFPHLFYTLCTSISLFAHLYHAFPPSLTVCLTYTLHFAGSQSLLSLSLSQHALLAICRHRFLFSLYFAFCCLSMHYRGCLSPLLEHRFYFCSPPVCTSLLTHTWRCTYLHCTLLRFAFSYHYTAPLLFTLILGFLYIHSLMPLSHFLSL